MHEKTHFSVERQLVFQRVGQTALHLMVGGHIVDDDECTEAKQTHHATPTDPNCPAEIHPLLTLGQRNILISRQ